MKLNTFLNAAILVACGSLAQANVAFKPQSTLSHINRDVRVTSSARHNARKSMQSIQGGSGDASKSTLSSSIFNLVKGIVGVGVLSLPSGIAAFGDAKSAIFPAMLLITVMGSLSAYNFGLIGRVCAVTGASSYKNAWEKSVGKNAWVPALACTSKTFLAVLAYSMVLAETFQGIANSMGLSVTRAQTVITLAITVLFPLCSMKNLASLAPFSLLGIMGMALTVACMGIRYFDGSYSLPSGKFLENLAELPVFGSAGASAALSPNTFILICMLSTAFMAHFNAPKFYNELEDNTIERFNTLVKTSFSVSIAFFCMATALGFATFGKSSAGFILSNYSSKDNLIGISRIAVAFALIFTYPLVFVGCRDGLISLMNVTAPTDSLLTKLTIVLLSLINFVAIYLKDISFVMSFGGATLGNALIYIFPAMMFKKVVKDMGEGAPDAWKNETAFVSFTMLLGVGMGIIGTTMALKST